MNEMYEILTLFFHIEKYTEREKEPHTTKHDVI